MRRYANYYKPGAWNVICDRTGFKVKITDTRREWNNAVVRRESFEERNEQDFLRGVRDDPAVPLARPRGDTITTNSPNLINDYNGLTADGLEWDLGSDWALNDGDGWEIDSFATSTDLTGARAKDLVIGIEGKIVIGDTLTLSGFTTLTTRSAGSFIGKLRFFNSAKTTVSTETMFTLSADSAGLRQSGSVTVPTASFVQVIFDASSLNAATFELRNVKLEIGSLTGFGEDITTSDL